MPTTGSPSPVSETGAEVARSPYPYRARVWWGDKVIAESASCLLVEQPDRPPLLFFPVADVHPEVLRTSSDEVPLAPMGTAEAWTLPDPGDHGLAGAPVVWRLRETEARWAGLAGYTFFDHDRLRVEVLDAEPKDEGRRGSTKRFPTWGDADDLIDMLDVRPLGASTFEGVARTDLHRPVVEGSQMLGQALVAAGRHTPGRRAVAAHMMFLRPADAAGRLLFELDQMSSGRTFSALSVAVRQGDRLCAAGTLLLDVTADDVIRHSVEPPKVPGPSESEPFDMGVTGRDLRIVDGAYTSDPDAPVGPPVLDAWVRFRRVPEDPSLHAGLLAQFTGHLSIAAALRPHPGVGQAQAHRSLSTGINAITLHLHRQVHADRWLLYHHLSTFAGDGMTHAECRVHDEDGHLVASFSVDAMVRAFAADKAGRLDERRAL